MARRKRKTAKTTSLSGRTQRSTRPRTLYTSVKRTRSSSTRRSGPQASTNSRDQERMLESKLEQTFYRAWCKQFELAPTLQHKFHPTRQWRFDFAWPSLKIAVEIQGFGEGHNSYDGMASDYEKHNAAVQYGWKIYYLMGYQLEPKTIKTTLNYIYSCLLGKTTHEVPKRESEWNNKIISGRRLLLEGPD